MEFKSDLYLVPTPIGNLGDITIRSLEVLNSVDMILAEDTRTSGVLLKQHGVSKPLKSYHIHNEHKLIDWIINEIKQGKKLALVSDAGTPAISDPGYLVVRECLKADIKVECLPGPTAFVPALVASGLPSDRFTFEGFLPQKKGRQGKISSLKEESRTMIFYESPHRLVKALEQFAEVFGHERQISVSRELTKIHEETVNGSISEVLNHYRDKKIKGEIVIVLAGAA